MSDPVMAICLIENPDPIDPNTPTLALYNLAWLFETPIQVGVIPDTLIVGVESVDLQITVVPDNLSITASPDDLQIEPVGDDLQIDVVPDNLQIVAVQT